MCIFSGSVREVTDTSIFVAELADGDHGLAYEMTLDTRAEVAMVLPVPLAAGSAAAFRFLNLGGYPRFFRDLERLFPRPGASRGLDKSLGLPGKTLAVHDVGAYVASFVPTRDDFGRLDPRFRMPSAVWDACPQYAAFGFAVFQLRPGAARHHPMAFGYTPAKPDRLFFPTVHAHDGAVPARADYHHALYYQHGRRFGPIDPNAGLTASAGPADGLDVQAARGLLNGAGGVSRVRLDERRANTDHVVRRAGDNYAAFHAL